MPFSIEQLIRGQVPVTVKRSQTVREAVKLMYENDFSQLPVVDERGKAIGLFTEKALTQMLHWDAANEYMHDPTEKWMERPATIVGSSRNIFDVADMLANSNAFAVVVGHEDQVRGVVTTYDMATFIAKWSHGFALAEDIEKRLRGYIDRVLPPGNVRDAAMLWAFPDKDDKTKAAKIYDELSLHDHVQLVMTTKCWPKFEPYFASKTGFEKLMRQVIPIRNQMMHFRGELTQAQLMTLQQVQRWLDRCPRVPEPTASDSSSIKGQTA